MVGVDPGHDVAAFCRERGLPIFEGTVEEARFTPASFDAVVVWNTFDQLPDPRPLLEQAVLLLRNGGVLVLRVPNGACFAWMLQDAIAPSLEASTTVRRGDGLQQSPDISLSLRLFSPSTGASDRILRISAGHVCAGPGRLHSARPSGLVGRRGRANREGALSGHRRTLAGRPVTAIPLSPLARLCV